MTMKSFTAEFSCMESSIIDQAVKINNQMLLEIVKTKILETAQSIVFEYVNNKLIEDTEKNRSYKNKNCEIKVSKKTIKRAKNDCDSKELKKEVSFEYCDREWKKNALIAVLESSKNGLSLTPNQIFDTIGVSKDRRKSLRRQLGLLMKKSGINITKSFENGTTRTGYFV